MTISNRFDTFFTEHDISYQVIEHAQSGSSIATAVAAQVPLNQIAKAVLLVDHQGRYLMAILPANNKISLSVLNDELNANFQLVKEAEVYKTFSDCSHGAVPPFGKAYHMNIVCDTELDDLDTVYVEAGDHENLLRLSHDDFETIIGEGRHLRFSRQVFH